MKFKPALLLIRHPLTGHFSPFLTLAPHLDNSVRPTSFDTTTSRPAGRRDERR